MTKLIINADDFGYSKGVNLGIIEAYQNGVVTSTTMMTNMPGAAHAAALAKENPDLGVGIHLVLDCGTPVNGNVPSLVNEETGVFHKAEGIARFAELSDIEKEYTSQIEKFLSFGLVPTHMDSHHGLHGHEKVYPIVEKLAVKYNLPIRKVSLDANHSSNVLLRTVDNVIHDFYGDDLSVELLINLIDQASRYETIEIMSHPAYIDSPLFNGSSYSIQRAKELDILTNQNVRQAILDKGIELVTYKHLANQSLV